ncbi:metallophosphoesterase [Oceanobacillus rekensis]|uniref:metallophosphoesterase n=1 Tax=Oceanobacillus rekensis TaxID=937927 RepID=UPI000B443A82|nr:metallophosphoesterase [Oceanobacillus rekensis]
MKRSRKKIYLLVILFFSLFLRFLYDQNNAITVTDFTISSNKIPQSFDGYKIIQLSDLHSKSFGKNQGSLTQKVKALHPDLILVTGDLIDRRRYNEEPSLKLIKEMVEIAPVYFVTGNHEWGSGKFISSLEDKLIDLGVNVMRNSHDSIYKSGDEINLLGIDDPSIDAHKSYADYNSAEAALEDSLEGLENQDSFRILLSHRPELFSLYKEFDMDLIFSGHAHGGQLRIPFLGGLIAPGQGLFPEYTSGIHDEDNSTLIVNRGLGNSLFPQRVLNKPEIVSVTLSTENPTKTKE